MEETVIFWNFLRPKRWRKQVFEPNNGGSRVGLILVLSVLCVAGCSENSNINANKLYEAKPDHPMSVKLVDRDGQGTLQMLGWSIRPASKPKPGQKIEITQYFQVERPVARDLMLFLHGEIPNLGRVLVSDRRIGDAKTGTKSWKKGEIWMIRQFLRLPPETEGRQVELLSGLFFENQRLTVWGEPGQSDGRNRIKLGKIDMEGYRGSKAEPKNEARPGELPSVLIPKTTATIAADGKLSEKAWVNAPILTFSDSLGRPIPTQFETKLRLLYDDKNLYVSFEAKDKDISCPFSKRDDPIYDHEAVELFIMPKVKAPALGPYIELQASPKGIIFDAAFTGRRTGMDTSFNAGQTVGTDIRGTLNQDDGQDEGFTSEWIVPFAQMRGVEKAPQAGEEWRMNAFRIEKYRQSGKLLGEYTAWSPPQVGDFHNVLKFGRMRFGP